MYNSVHGGLLLYVLFRTTRQSCLMILLFCADSVTGRRSTCTDQAQRLFQLFSAHFIVFIQFSSIALSVISFAPLK